MFWARMKTAGSSNPPVSAILGAGIAGVCGDTLALPRWCWDPNSTSHKCCGAPPQLLWSTSPAPSSFTSLRLSTGGRQQRLLALRGPSLPCIFFNTDPWVYTVLQLNRRTNGYFHKPSPCCLRHNHQPHI